MVEQAFVGRDGIRAPLKTPAWEPNRRLGRAFPEALLRGTLLKRVLTIAALIAPRRHKGNFEVVMQYSKILNN